MYRYMDYVLSYETFIWKRNNLFTSGDISCKFFNLFITNSTPFTAFIPVNFVGERKNSMNNFLSLCAVVWLFLVVVNNNSVNLFLGLGKSAIKYCS